MHSSLSYPPGARASAIVLLLLGVSPSPGCRGPQREPGARVRDAGARPDAKAARPAPDARTPGSSADAAVSERRRPAPPVHYLALEERCEVKDRIRGHVIERVTTGAEGKVERARLGCGRTAEREPDGYSHAAAVLTRHTCSDMGGHPCGHVTGYFDVHGAGGKVVYRDSAEEAPLLRTIAGRYLIFETCPHGAPACALRVIDTVRGGQFDGGHGSVTRGAEVQGTRFVYVDGVDDEAAVFCFETDRFRVHRLRKVPPLAGAKVEWVGPGRVRIRREAQGNGEDIDETVSCPPTGDRPVNPEAPDGIVPVKATVRPDAARFRGDAGRTGRIGADESGGRVIAGEIKWRYEARGFSASAAVHGNTVYVGSFDGSLHALDLATGTVRWRFKTQGKVRSSAAVAHGLVFFGSNDRHVYAVDAGTGALRWKHATRGSVFSSPAVGPTQVIVGSDDGQVIALEPGTGRLLWRAPAGGPVASSPLLEGGAVYVGVNHPRKGALLALDAATGRERWRREVDQAIKSSPALADGWLLVGTYAGDLLAVDPASGAPRWRVDLGGSIPGTPAVEGGLAYVGTMEGRLAAVRVATGKTSWTRELGSGLFSSPAVRGGVVYIGTKDGRLVAVDAMTGAPRWTQRLRSAVDASPVLSPNGLLLVGNIATAFYALR